MIVKTDFSGLLNSDVAPQKLQPTDYVNLQNMRIGTTDKGRTGQMESIGSTLGITNSYLPAGTNISIGVCEDEAKQRFFEFVWNSNGDHAIYCYDGTVYKVLLNSQVTGGLGFSKDYYIHSVEIIGNLLYWTDNLNQPRRINIEAGIKLNHPDYVTDQVPYLAGTIDTITYSLFQENITLIRRAPQLPLECAKMKSTDLGVTVVQNFIKNLSLQFCYYYVFRDYETSVTSTRSLLFNYNFDEETDGGYDVIDIKIPLTEKIQQDVQEIYLVAKNNESGKYFIINKWSKGNPIDINSISLHNSGTKQLEFIFKGDYFGAGVDDPFAVKPFESIPLLSKTLELAKDRVFLGNNLLGYNTPSTTSLGISLLQGGATSQTQDTVWLDVIINAHTSAQNGTGESDITRYYDTVLVTGFGYYALPDNSTPSTVDFNDMIFIGTTENDVTNYFLSDIVYSEPGADVTITDYSITNSPNAVHVINIGLVVPLTGRFFKTDSVYKVSIVFYDAFQRKCGVVDVSGTLTIPTRKFAYDSYYTYIKWTLRNTNALAEIPIWATHYQIVITESRNIQFFIEGVATKYAYVKKDDAGLYTYTDTVPADDYVGLAIDLSELLNNNIGYTFQDKDLAVIYMDAVPAVYTEVIGTDGKWAILNYKDIGTIATTPAPFVYEIRSPKVQGADDVFYEVSQCYIITNSGTSSRVYSSLTGQIRGDTYIVKRTVGGTDYYMESISPNDKHPLSWFTDAGRPNAVDRIGQKLIPNSIVFSNVNLQGTKNNGLSSFDALDADSVPSENGAINKLQLTSKTQDAGTVMLAICANETTSIYLGEAQLVDQTGNAFVAKSNGVIGTMNTLKGSYGTINPESVVEYRGEVFWFDAQAGDFVFYSVNGLNSMTKATKRFAKLYSDQYKGLASADIEALGNRPLIIGGVDIYHKEILWSIPKVGDNPNGVLTDINMDYPYDLLDFQGKTIVFKGEFMGSYSFNAESFVSIGNKLFYFVGGNMFLCNQTTSYNNFNGVQQKARIMFAINAEPSTPKALIGISVESNVCPDYVHFRSEYPDIQSSDLVATDFVKKEGIYYATALRDRLSPNASGTYEEKLCKGDRIRGTYIYCLIEFWTSDLVQLKAVNVSFIDSIGHKV